MMDKKASEAIEQAVCFELQNIVKNYGATYASNHEGYAVLKEEVEEAQACLEDVLRNVSKIWVCVKANKDFMFDLNMAKEFSIALAGEAVQCAAVCERFMETIKSEIPTS